MFDDTLAGYMGVSRGLCTYEEVCGHAGVMERDGSVYSCDHFVFPENYLGNIKNQTIPELMLSKKQLDFGEAKRSTLSEECISCPFFELCNGGCPKDRFATSVQLDPNRNYLCNGLRSY